MEENKNTLSFSRNTEIKDTACESACDYTLPDYKADVKKLLYTKAEAVPSSEFFDSGELTCSGIVCYSVVYLDGENKLSGAEFTSEYDCAIKLDAEGCEDFHVDTRVASFSVRLTGPRKFSAKASLALDASALNTEELKIEGDAIAEEGIQLAKESILVGMTKHFCSEEREFAERIAELDGAIVDEVRVVHTSADVVIDSVHLLDSKATVKGEIRIYAIIENGELPPYRVEHTIPFEETLEVAGISSVAYLSAEGIITSLSADVNPEEFGCGITVDVITEICLSARENSEVELIKDGYLTTAPTESERSVFEYREQLPSIKETLGFECELDRVALGLSSAREILFVSAVPRLDAKCVSDSVIDIEGELRFTGIATEMSDSGELSYVNFKICEPYQNTLKYSGGELSGADVACRFGAYSAKAEIDRDRVVLSCELKADIAPSIHKRAEYLSKLSRCADESYVKSSSLVTVYYPDPQDTLFEIAKRFHTTVRDIAVNNSLTEAVVNSFGEPSALSGVKRLIIR